MSWSSRLTARRSSSWAAATALARSRASSSRSVISPDLPASLQISPHLPRSPQISPDLPMPPRISPDLPASPRISPDLPRSPQISPRPALSPGISGSLPVSPPATDVPCSSSVASEAGKKCPGETQLVVVCGPRSETRILHVSQPALERTRLQPHSPVFGCIHCLLLRCTHAVLSPQYRPPPLRLADSARRLPISPHISPYLPISPALRLASPARRSAARTRACSRSWSGSGGRASTCARAASPAACPTTWRSQTASSPRPAPARSLRPRSEACPPCSPPSSPGKRCNLPISPHLSPSLPRSPHILLVRPAGGTRGHLSPDLPVSPRISPYLPGGQRAVRRRVGLRRVLGQPSQDRAHRHRLAAGRDQAGGDERGGGPRGPASLERHDRDRKRLVRDGRGRHTLPHGAHISPSLPISAHISPYLPQAATLSLTEHELASSAPKE